MEVGGASGYIHNQSYWLVLIHLNSTDISGREIRAGFYVEYIR